MHKDWLNFFGYTKLPHDPENTTGFFPFEDPDDEMTRQYKGWQRQNEAMVNWACQLTDEDLTRYKYRLSDPEKEVPLMDFNTSALATAPIMHWFERELYKEEANAFFAE